MQNQLDRRGRTLAAVMFLASAAAELTGCASQQTFASPEEGKVALVEAIRADDSARLQTILGRHGRELFRSGDTVADQHYREAFLKAYGEAHSLIIEGEERAVLVIGRSAWPVPIPLLQSPDGWRFETAQGEQQILARRIGRNQWAAMQVCFAVVDAVNEYATQDMNDNGIPDYTPRFVSTPGTKDGLYWPAKAGEPPSPLSPLLAAAMSEGYSDATSKPLAPYHGYFYRILMEQGEAASGGAYDYVIKGIMIGGFALLAYPAEHGVSGNMSFLVNQDGSVYEQDLGKNTFAIASRTTAFNPDSRWRSVRVLAKDR